MNAAVHSLAVAPDGTLYAGGSFTTAGGGAASKVAAWNGTSWSALDSGLSSTAYALKFGPDGILYAGGSFTNAGGGGANYIAAWDGTSWSALGAGTGAAVRAIDFGPDGTLYAGGEFTTAGGASANYIAAWDGTSWSALGTGANNTIVTLSVAPAGTLYVGGSLTTAGGIAVGYVARWNGTAWSAMGSGVDGLVYSVYADSVGNVYIGGTFTTAGGVALSNGITVWNNSGYTHLDVNLPGTVAGLATLVKPYDNSADVYIGFGSSGIVASNKAGLVTATNEGNQPAYPVIKYTRAGGTSATIATLRNETTGKELLFNYALLDGETLTINLTPTAKSVVSSFFGQRFDAVLANSDFGTFTLLPGANSITSFVINDGATITATMEWQEAYKSVD